MLPPLIDEDHHLFNETSLLCHIIFGRSQQTALRTRRRRRRKFICRKSTMAIHEMLMYATYCCHAWHMLPQQRRSGHGKRERQELYRQYSVYTTRLSTTTVQW